VIASATLAKQQVLVSRLECIAAETRAANFAAPAIVVIGDIVHVRQQLLDASAHAATAIATAPAPAPAPAGGANDAGESSACGG
jgi:precorrin-4 methylase